jgi:predicted amidohydrolase YtcJ
MGAVKMSIDGGLSAPIMWTTKAYENRPGFHGEQRIPDSVFYRVAKRARELGWQLGIHVMGDGAVVMVVDQLERIYAETPPSERRDYLHHVAVLPPEATLAKMSKLNIGVASQPGFLLSLGSYADEALGPDDEPHQQPSASLVKRGIRVSYGSDAGPYGPISALYASVSRRGWNGVVHGPQEAMSMADAIRMHTIEPAYFNFDEKTRGSITPGKVADFVVLNVDPFSVAPDAIKDIKINCVIIGGRELIKT